MVYERYLTTGLSESVRLGADFQLTSWSRYRLHPDTSVVLGFAPQNLFPVPECNRRQEGGKALYRILMRFQKRRDREERKEYFAAQDLTPIFGLPLLTNPARDLLAYLLPES
jgi:hypothetical protein